jgi:uncharacterized protein DUF350
MDYVQDLLNDLAGGLLYGLVGIALLALGYLVIDVLTPGKLGRLLVDERNRNAGILVSSGLLSIGIIVTTAIITSGGDLSHGLGEAAGFGLIGIFLLAVASGVVDLITPGKLSEIVMREGPQPMVYVTSAALLSVGGIIAASIS